MQCEIKLTQGQIEHQKTSILKLYEFFEFSKFLEFSDAGLNLILGGLNLTLRKPTLVCNVRLTRGEIS